MKALKHWVTVPTIFVIALATTGAALSQSIAITSGSQPIQVSGTSGGSQKNNGCAGYTSSAPNHVIQVAEDSNLKFVLQATGQPALLIRGMTGSEFCVPADSYSGGRVEIPGRWSKGTYNVFVGDRAGGQHAYTLSISRN